MPTYQLGIPVTPGWINLKNGASDKIKCFRSMSYPAGGSAGQALIETNELIKLTEKLAYS